jgi:hypothetical protein
MSGKWTMKYGTAAVITAIAIIIVSLFATTSLNPNSTGPQNNNPQTGTASFTVMLTDPPTVPAGTTILNLTYSDVSLHVTYPNSTTAWVPLGVSGTVNLFSLVNMTQTLASTTLPINSTVDKVQFTIADVKAVVNNVTYNVTALTNALILNIANSRVNQTLSGVLLDFNPTLTQIQATDADGNAVTYYVLVPSAKAIIVNALTSDQMRVGTIVRLGENHRVALERVVQEFQNNVTITQASLTVDGNSTALSITLTNDGTMPFRILGLSLNGDFNATRTWLSSIWDTRARGGMGMGRGMFRQGMYNIIVENIHPKTIPFKINDTSLVPLLGGNFGMGHGNNGVSSLVLQPGETVTVTFNDVIALQTERNDISHPAMVITPIAGNDYTIRLMGEGFETFTVTATTPVPTTTPTTAPTTVPTPTA